MADLPNPHVAKIGLRTLRQIADASTHLAGPVHSQHMPASVVDIQTMTAIGGEFPGGNGAVLKVHHATKALKLRQELLVAASGELQVTKHEHSRSGHSRRRQDHETASVQQTFRSLIPTFQTSGG